MDMENVEDIPVEPEEVQSQEITIEDTDFFEFRRARLPENPFLSRGCCQSPKLYHKNEMVFQHRCSKFDSYDWLKDVPAHNDLVATDLVEVRFKDSRKDYFRIPPEI